MSYLARLEALIAEKQVGHEPTEPTKPGSVGFVGDRDSRFPEFRDSPGTERLSNDAGEMTGIAAWRVALAGLDPSSPPVPLASERWHQMLDDADRFLAQWGHQAVALGWSELDLFGVSPGFARRLDRDGLIYGLEGRPVIAMTAEAATIDRGSGPPTRYYRTKLRGAVLWWSAAHSAGI